MGWRGKYWVRFCMASYTVLTYCTHSYELYQCRGYTGTYLNITVYFWYQPLLLEQTDQERQLPPPHLGFPLERKIDRTWDTVTNSAKQHTKHMEETAVCKTVGIGV